MLKTLRKVGAMQFKDRRHEHIAVERLIRLLNEKPILVVNAANAGGLPCDRCRAFVIALLLTSVTGTWSFAYFIS
jgi:hypothetical protein